MSLATSSPLPRHIKFIYGLGDWGTAASTTARNVFWFFFLTSVVGMDAGLVGTILLVGRLWDGINDPLIGMLTDRVNTRWGRRRPFLLFAAVPFGVSFALLFFVPPGATTGQLVIYYIVASLITGGLFKFVAEQVIAPRLGGGAAALQTGYALSAALWGLSMIIPYFILFGAVREPQSHQEAVPIRPLQTFREVFSNRPFRLGATIYLLTFATVDVVLLIFVRFLIDYVRVPLGFDNLLLAIVLGLALITLPLTVKMMHRFGKRRTYIGSMVFLSIVLLIMSQVPPGGHTMVLIAAIFGGLGYGAANVIPWAMVADVIEVDELRTGQRREGVYYGYLVFFRKLASAVAAFSAGHLLSAAGYVSSRQGSAFIEQPESALLVMRLLVGVVPAVMLFFSIIAAWRYPLDRETHRNIRRQLAQRRGEAPPQ